MNILIIEAHPIFCAGLVQILNTLNVRLTITEARTLDDFKRDQTAPGDLDLVLADLPLSGPNPMHRLDTLVNAFDGIPVVVISEAESRKCALEAINLGAQGFIPKSAQKDEFVQCLRLVIDGSVYLSKLCLREAPSVVDSTDPNTRGASELEGFANLTKRQQETLLLLATGSSNHEIAHELGISEKTVRFYITAILKVLNVRNRTQAALLVGRTIRNNPHKVTLCAS